MTSKEKVLIKDIGKMNQLNYKKSMNWDYVNYLDTGNLTKNKIIDIVKIDLGNEKLPSRAKRIPVKNSILYSTVRPNQEHYGFVKEDNIPNLLISTGFTVIDINEDKAIPKYVYYYLIQNSIIDKLQNIGETSTSAYPSVKVKDIENIEIDLPSLREQDKIAKTLSSFDDKIENNNKIINNLEEQAQAIFKSWFVDFEPFQEEEFVESELGVIPKKWEVRTLQEVFNIKYGKNLPTKNLLDTGYPVFGGNGQIGFYSDFLYEKSKLLISCRGAASGKTVVSRPYSFITNNSLVMEEKDSVYFYYFKELFKIMNFENFATGSAQPQITIKNIKNIKVLIPIKSIVEKYSNIAENIFKYQGNLINENEILEETRDTLLPKLMSGEIRVDETSEVM